MSWLMELPDWVLEGRGKYTKMLLTTKRLNPGLLWLVDNLTIST